ncbi:MAG: hypothetical protein HQK49_14755 [Oligoflexia bacterium]|nr:hypothetical protein [Oligoflexia bacterium]
MKENKGSSESISNDTKKVIESDLNKKIQAQFDNNTSFDFAKHNHQKNPKEIEKLIAKNGDDIEDDNTKTESTNGLTNTINNTIGNNIIFNMNSSEEENQEKMNADNRPTTPAETLTQIPEDDEDNKKTVVFDLNTLKKDLLSEATNTLSDDFNLQFTANSIKVNENQEQKIEQEYDNTPIADSEINNNENDNENEDEDEDAIEKKIQDATVDKSEITIAEEILQNAAELSEQTNSTFENKESDNANVSIGPEIKSEAEDLVMENIAEISTEKGNTGDNTNENIDSAKVELKDQENIEDLNIEVYRAKINENTAETLSEIITPTNPIINTVAPTEEDMEFSNENINQESGANISTIEESSTPIDFSDSSDSADSSDSSDSKMGMTEHEATDLFSVGDFKNSLSEEKSAKTNNNNNNKNSSNNKKNKNLLSETTSETIQNITTTDILPTNREYTSYYEDELVKLKTVIRNLREDREHLIKKIERLDLDKNKSDQEHLSMKALLDEKKIELAISKKRHSEEIENLNYRIKIAENRRHIAEEKNKNYQLEVQKLGQKVKVDLNAIKQREQELENQLELLRTDTELQIATRDNKILELKRQIDTLEFDIEGLMKKEQESKNIQTMLENKVDKIKRNLENALNIFEEDMLDGPSKSALQKKLKI